MFSASLTHLGCLHRRWARVGTYSSGTFIPSSLVSLDSFVNNVTTSFSYAESSSTRAESIQDDTRGTFDLLQPILSSAAYPLAQRGSSGPERCGMMGTVRSTTCRSHLPHQVQVLLSTVEGLRLPKLHAPVGFPARTSSKCPALDNVGRSALHRSNLCDCWRRRALPRHRSSPLWLECSGRSPVSRSIPSMA